MAPIVSTTLAKYFELVSKIEDINIELNQLLNIDDFTESYKTLLLKQIKQNNKFIKKLQKRWTR